MKPRITFLKYFKRNYLLPSGFLILFTLLSLFYKEPLAVKCFLTILGILFISSLLSYIRRFSNK